MSSRSRLPNSILCAVLVLRFLRVSRLACISSGVARRLYTLASRYPWSPALAIPAELSVSISYQQMVDQLSRAPVQTLSAAIEALQQARELREA